MPALSELAALDATAQADLVRQDKATPLELVEAAIERIERTNPAINAVVTPMFDRAREAARGDLPDGPFTGVPCLLKDLSATYAGVRMTGGSAFLAEFVPEMDSELVRRLKAAGFVVVGKTNTPELGIEPTTEPDLFGPCRNPWDTRRTAGGSSGGSAAAVAAGMVPAAHGNDGGGSIRIPASCCGVFGLKPTRGRIPLGPNFGDIMGGLVADHALTRTVRDSAAILDATAGPSTGDPYFAPPPRRPYREEVDAPPGRLRVAFSDYSPLGGPVHPECRGAVRAAAALCEQLGHTVVEAAPPLDAERYVTLFMALWAGGCAWSVDGLALVTGRSPTAHSFEPLTWALYERGKKVGAADYLLALQGLQQMARSVAGFFLEHDVWLTPTLAEPPFELGALDFPADQLEAAIQRAFAFTPFTSLFNVTGQPAMSVPLAWSEAGLPIGVQFVGRYGDEATLFRLAAQLEEARPWKERWPPEGL
ncbi:MAG: amidase [Gemmatimonadota bacterium]